MQYSLTGIDSHLDFGFGITGETYYNTAKFLDDHKTEVQAFQLREMPINFLYRHSIELLLKSLIIIFHKKLQINYDKESYNSKHPKILSNGKWVSLYRSHWIDELYNYWKDSLLIPNQDKLNELAPRGDWKEYDEISKALPIITKYDRESSFFRYPVTENSEQDLEKFTMQPIDVETLFKLLNKPNEEKENGEEKKGKVIMALKDENDEIVKAYIHADNLLEDVTKSLQQASNYFYCIHIMTRVELCKGR